MESHVEHSASSGAVPPATLDRAAILTKPPGLGEVSKISGLLSDRICMLDVTVLSRPAPESFCGAAMTLRILTLVTREL